MLKSILSFNRLITAEVDSGIPPERIVLAGFSQGGAMSLLTGLTNERRLAGIVVLSGWLPINRKVKAMVSSHATTLPIFWGHGAADPVVPHSLATRSVEVLKNEIGIRTVQDSDSGSHDIRGLEFHTYPGLAHSSSPKELSTLQSWLKIVIPNNSQTVGSEQ